MSMGNGVLVAVVSEIDDPLGLGRVKVTLPALDSVSSHWAHVVTPMAGPRRGMLFRPEIGDTVLVAGEMGDLTRLYVLGAMWSGAAPPPPAAAPNAKNDVRAIVSRSGHVLTFDDTPGRERLELVDKTGKRSFRIDCSDGKIDISANGSGDSVNVAVPEGSVNIKAASRIDIESTGGSVTVSATGGTLRLNGDRIELNAGAVDIAGSTVKINGAGMVTVRGGLVNIN